MATILCVDDEPAVGVLLEHALDKLGHGHVLVRNIDDALTVVGNAPVDLILSDYRMPNGTGLDLLDRLAKEGSHVPVIMMTGYSSIEHAVLSIKRGAVDYLLKPVRPEALEIAIDHALEVVRLKRENDAFRREISQLRIQREIVGDSAAIRAVMETIATVAPTRATVLLEGESGTGKELFARAIHDQSPRQEQPFVTMNCAALPEGLVESALFGHERGAFTGATARAAGAFERANGGTLFLDEIAEMRLDLQSKLLRVVQEQEFERVGGQQTLKVDVRLVAATNKDLHAAVAAGRFREDLYYRLSVVPVHPPPLRERLEDIPLLVQHFVRRVARDTGAEASGVLPETIALLQRHTWPGNVRELANAVERAVILARGGPLRPELFEASLRRAAPGAAAVSATPAAPAATPAAAAAPAPAAPAEPLTVEERFNLDRLEREMIQRALVETRGNRTQAAKLLGLSERTLRNKLNSPDSRGS